MFGQDLDFDSFARAFADDELRVLLGIELSPMAANRIAEDPALLLNIFRQWANTHQPGTLVNESVSTPIVTRVSSPSTGVPTGSPDLEEEYPPYFYAPTGLWQLIFSAVLLLAASVSTYLGHFYARSERIRGDGVILYYGSASVTAMGQGIAWAILFLILAVCFLAACVRASLHARRRVLTWLGVFGLLVATGLAVEIIITAAAVSTWR